MGYKELKFLRILKIYFDDAAGNLPIIIRSTKY
jgi:hypothetical protein